MSRKPVLVKPPQNPEGIDSPRPASGDAGATPRQVRIRSRGRLPHWEMDRGVYFVTFRLFDSLPQSALRVFEDERENIVATAKQLRRELSASERARLKKLFSERIETYLDAGAGACYLARPEIARLVSRALCQFDGQRYRLFAWCIMPNHVHVVMRTFPQRRLDQIVHSWKSFTAKQANRHLGRLGRFWQREYYDHLVRDEREFDRIVRYVVTNPAKANLRNWPWVKVMT